MSRLSAITTGSCFLCISLTALAQGPTGVQVGKNLPGSFQPYNINAAIPLAEEPEDPKADGPKRPKYTSKGKFHCLVTEYDLDPVVMLVARGLEDNAALGDLLTKLDAALDRNKLNRLRCFVVFQADDLNVVEDDEKRNEMSKKLEKLVLDAKLTRVVVTLAGKDDLAKYKLEPKALTAILYNRLRVEAIHPIDKDKLDVIASPEVKAILTDVGKKLGATR